jgi:hypothetical protein
MGSDYHYILIKNATHDAFKGLSCFHEVWKFSPLNITAGGKEVPSAHMVMMTVMFSLPPLHC